MDILELSKIIQKQGEAWEQHKATNDEILKAKADGKAVGLLEEKLAKIAADMDKLISLRSDFDNLMLKMQRPTFEAEDAKGAEELRLFNIALKSFKPTAPDYDQKQYNSYKEGFFKMARGSKYEHLSADEQKAMIAGSDPDGGYLLPVSTQGRIVAKIYEKSVMRQICDVQTISTQKLTGIVDNDESDAGWVSEIGTRDDTDTPQVGKWEIEAHEMYAQPKATQTVIDDAMQDIEAWLAKKTADKFARVESVGFITGNGVGKARGLTTYTTVATGDETRAWGQFEHVKTGANGAFHTTKADPVLDIIGAMKDEYLQSASFLMRREVRTAVRKMKEATSDRYLWEPSLEAGQPDRLAGYPVRIDQFMPALATDSLSLAFGDFSECYTIVDRAGINTLRDPYTAKPYVRFYSTKRTGGGAINFEAVKFLKFAS
jgi:HK97 family phage major capsid protein